MDWRTLISHKRISHTGQLTESRAQSVRSPFERDWDRILFSNAFRRMHDKTQVFPLPEDDFVHSRLTHSLEVASVGRSLGKTIGQIVVQRHAKTIRKKFSVDDLGHAVAAACVAHDIGNPPFGHAGEDAIASFFKTSEGKSALKGLQMRERDDLLAFEGNAQGFRLLTRLQQEADSGLRLTITTLAAFSKYPREAGADVRDKRNAAKKKHGFFQAEKELFSVISSELGLPRARSKKGGIAWCRHPLAYLVEAADDICYSILDIEDGVRLGHVTWDAAKELLHPIASRQSEFSESRLKACNDLADAIGYLRGAAIGRMIHEAAEVFLECEDVILEGKLMTTLTEMMKSKDYLGQLRDLAKSSCYNAPNVVEIELAGYEALGGLLARFVPSVLDDSVAKGKRPERLQKLVQLLRRRGAKIEGASSRYERILRVTDYVSGMTDRAALSTYRRLKGIAVPGRVA